MPLTLITFDDPDKLRLLDSYTRAMGMVAVRADSRAGEPALRLIYEPRADAVQDAELVFALPAAGVAGAVQRFELDLDGDGCGAILRLDVADAGGRGLVLDLGSADFRGRGVLSADAHEPLEVWGFDGDPRSFTPAQPLTPVRLRVIPRAAPRIELRLRALRVTGDVRFAAQGMS